MQGKIIKGIAGFYYINVEKQGVYQCKAKGIFRNKSITPLVGDNVIINVIDEDKKLGNIEQIIERKNSLIRPAVANIDQAIIIFAITDPSPNLGLLDRFLILMQKQEIKTIICFNKLDIDTDSTAEELANVYKNSGSQIITCSAAKGEGIELLTELIRNKTTVLAGPSGVGKSTIMNILQPEAEMKTGSISEKIRRGKHTTRHSEIFYVSDNTYVMDTPGFSSLYVNEVDENELKRYYYEFREYNNICRFNGCNHINEPDCAVKEAVDKGIINKTRYDSYKILYEDLKCQRKY